MTDVVFPALSTEEPEHEGVVATWFVGDGDVIRAGQLLAEVQVDKVSAEVEAPVAGTVALIAKEEEVVRQGAVIARIT